MPKGQTIVLSRHRDREVLLTKTQYSTIRWVRCDSSHVAVAP